MILEELESKDFSKRRAARNSLTDYIDRIEELNREKVINKLLLIIRDKSNSYALRLGVAYSLGRIKTFFWEVKDQTNAEKIMYELFRQEKDPTLRTNQDSALMKAKGLYWDAIHDYNEGKLGRNVVTEGVAKFKKVINDFPKSSYAPRAHYYLAKYYTRVYLKRKDKGIDANKNELIAEKSNQTFQEYLRLVEKGEYEPSDEMNARYYFALNWVLLDNFGNAINELNKIVNSPTKKKYTIYVYEFYYSKGNGNVIDRYFPSDQLALYTIKYLQNNLQHDDNYLNDFVKYLNKYSPEE
jgi:hypothetical protein